MNRNVSAPRAPCYWPSPAKLNLMLRITGRRTDGYHTLQTVFQLLDYGDEIAIDPLDSGEIYLLGPTAGVNGSIDLAVRAALLLKAMSGSPMGAAISVDKRLPIGSGLGGGSSNAATVLYALNYLWRIGWDIDQLAAAGLALGADVPVFVRGLSAWAEGVGELLTPMALPDRWFLVLLPGIHISTAEVFADPSLTRNSPAITMRSFVAEQFDNAAQNSCRAVVTARYPEIAQALTWLTGSAHTRMVGMSGTGSSLFAAFADERSARNLLEKIPAPWSGFVAKGTNCSPLHATVDACRTVAPVRKWGE